MLRNEKIGELYVRQILQKGTTDYKLESLIIVDKIINMKVDYKLNAHFEEGKLIRSSTWQKSNHRVNINTSTTLIGDHYLVESPNKKTKVHEEIDFNLCMLYFHEPNGRKRIWSDSYGEFIKIRSVGPHRYELLLPDGKKNYYTYNYGICSLVETEQLFTKINFLLIPNKAN